MSGRIVATDAALAAIASLTARYGPLMFHQSGGCCDGSSPICLLEGELLLGPGDLELGTVGGARFFVDADRDARLGRPTLVLDAAPGAAEGFSIEALDDIHFLTRLAPAAGRRPAHDGDRFPMSART